jgi:hypothetical protein
VDEAGHRPDAVFAVVDHQEHLFAGEEVVDRSTPRATSSTHSRSGSSEKSPLVAVETALRLFRLWQPSSTELSDSSE